MIPKRYAWLLRDTATCFDADLGRGHACRVCRALGRGETALRPTQLDAHVGSHRREKVSQDADPEAEKIELALG